MSPLALGVVAALAVLVVGYFTHGRFVARAEGLDDARATPAVATPDGRDFVPTRRSYLLGQHFSAIAAAGPIAGPILACQAFGWLPCVLWIVLGGIFVGAVHDFSALVASVRHGGASVAEVVRRHVGSRAWIAMLVFTWVALVYVIVAFADITARTFVGATSDVSGAAFNPGGAVAFASAAYLALALVMGLVQRLGPPLWLVTLVFVPATLGVVAMGTRLSTLLLLDVRTWIVIVLAYCVVAALLPVGVLLQPRGYLGGFVLYLALGGGLLGLVLADVTIEQPAFKGWSAPSGTLFPFLFVTIACGACSGFHGLVCSGTTSKQVAREGDCRPIGYGAMLLESFVALLALATVVMVADDAIGKRSPGTIYGDGLGRLVASVIGEEHVVLAATFGAMAFSTFVFDTIDVSTRLGRYIVQELVGWQGRAAAVGATLLTVAPAALVLLAPAAGSAPAHGRLWTLFGSANQLLAGLTLMAVATWLRADGRRTWFVVAPLVLVLAVTVTALVLQATRTDDLLVRSSAIALLLLAGLVAVDTVRSLRRQASASVVS